MFWTFILKFGRLLTIVCIGMAVGGCSRSGTETGVPAKEAYLIRIGNSIVTLEDFNQAFEIAKTAYPHQVLQDSNAQHDLRVRILNQLKAETLIKERARELQIDVSASEIKKAVREIKADYPADLFKQVFVERAVSRHQWEKRLKMRLLMEKVLAQELESRVAITAEDISKYSKEYQKYGLLQPAIEAGAGDTNAAVIKFLHMKKKQELYQDWITMLQRKYSIQINQDLWERISRS